MAFVQSFFLFLALAVCCVVAAIVITLMNNHWSNGKKLLAVPVGLIGALLATVVIQAVVSAHMNQTSNADPPGSASDSVSAPTSSPVSSSPSEDPPSSSPARPSHYYLADLDPLKREKEGRNCTQGCTGFDGGAARIQGAPYPSSYLMEVEADGRRSTAVWNLARSCTKLNMTVGINDERAQRAQVTFTLSTDRAQPKKLATVGPAEPASINESVAGAAQIEIAAYVSGPEAPDEVPIVLGDARLTCEPASLRDNDDS